MDNINTVLVNDLTGQPWNSNVAYNNSWLNVHGAGFPLFAQASYITNLDDLTISLSAGHIELGDINIADGITFLNATVNPIRIGYNGLRTISTLADPNSDIFANIVNLGGGVGALRVLSQDLTATADSVAIGDHLGNYATITGGSLNVNLTNPTTAVSVTNLQSTTVTNWDVLSAAINNSTYTTLPSNPANEITILNNTGGTMYIKNTSKTIGLPIDNNTSVDLKLISNTNEVAIKASSNNKTVFATFISYN